MKVIIGRILALSLVAIAVFAIIKDETLFTVDQVNIQVTMNEPDRLAWNDLTNEVEKTLRAYQGASLWKVSLADVQRKLSAFSLLKDVQVKKSWPHSLDVQYSLPTLKAIHQETDGKYKVLAEDGRWIGPTKWSRLPRLPWLKGDWVTQKPIMKEGVLSLLKQLPDKGPMSAQQVSEIQFNDIDGFLLTLVKSAQQVRFGSDNFEVKSLRVAQVLEYLQIRGLESRVIDANFSKKVLVRLRNHP
ncbi:MAG: hypothetical protein RJB66_2237 [Pseudomonadota bacterium]|jgi:cell division protein FtsQ